MTIVIQLGTTTLFEEAVNARRIVSVTKGENDQYYDSFGNIVEPENIPQNLLPTSPLNYVEFTDIGGMQKSYLTDGAITLYENGTILN